MPGRRWSGGLHQAIEAKEGVEVKPESITLASITFQNLFRMYKKLAGMTGTALTSAEEFDKVYGLDVVPIPTNKPIIRVDLSDRVYKTEAAKFNAVVSQIKNCLSKGQPVLVGTRSVEKNEYLSKLLAREGVKHEVLNAKNHEREGEIIAQAGSIGAVTIATNMAGRGVDILLGGNPPDPQAAQKVREAGGLFIIGTERHEARRIDNQLRGRGGRQGDPGTTQFFISLEDDLLRIFGGDQMKKLMEMLKVPEDQPIESKMLSKRIEEAQTKIEGMHFDARKQLLDYDSVMNKQREIIYKKRLDILQMNDEKLHTYILDLANRGNALEKYQEREKENGTEPVLRAARFIALRTIDYFWQEHLELMDNVRDSVRLRAYGQQDPLVEYKNEANKQFRILLETIEANILQNLLTVTINKNSSNITTPNANYKKNSNFNNVGRNDPCPCGSGKKYKKCHGK